MKKTNLLFNVLVALMLLVCFALSFIIINYQNAKIDKLYQQIEFRDETIKELKSELNGETSKGISFNQCQVL